MGGSLPTSERRVLLKVSFCQEERREETADRTPRNEHRKQREQSRGTCRGLTT